MRITFEADEMPRPRREPGSISNAGRRSCRGSGGGGDNGEGPNTETRRNGAYGGLLLGMGCRLPGASAALEGAAPVSGAGRFRRLGRRYSSVGCGAALRAARNGREIRNTSALHADGICVPDLSPVSSGRPKAGGPQPPSVRSVPPCLRVSPSPCPPPPSASRTPPPPLSPIRSYLSRPGTHAAPASASTESRADRCSSSRRCG